MVFLLHFCFAPTKSMKKGLPLFLCGFSSISPVCVSIRKFTVFFLAEEDIFRRRNWTGKREADNEIDKLSSRKKHKKQETISKDNSSKRAKVATSSKNGIATKKKDSSSEEDIPVAKKPPVNASEKDAYSSFEDDNSSAEEDVAVNAAASEKEESSDESSDESCSEDDNSSADEDVAVKNAPAAAAAASEKEESSDESSDGSSSQDDSCSAEEENAVIGKASAAASKKEESSKESSSDNDEPDAAQPTKLKKTSAEIDSHEDDSDSNVDKVPTRVSSSYCRAKPLVWKTWMENETEFLIGIFYEELVIHKKDLNQLDWGGIVRKLYHRAGKQSSVTEVQTLYKKFRDDTMQFMDLLQVTGYEWNRHNNKVTCKDEVWEDTYWIHGGEKRFRNKGLLHYHLLRDIFNTGVQESNVQTIMGHEQTPVSSRRFWSWLFG